MLINSPVDQLVQWGMEIVFDGMQASYGPWAERNRALIQSFFFPPTYENLEVHPESCPGQRRSPPEFTLLIVFKGTPCAVRHARLLSVGWVWRVCGFVCVCV